MIYIRKDVLSLRILLIRHAEPDYTIDSLTPKGCMEAELLSRRLINYQIRDYFCSPLGRARDTAAYTLEKLGREADQIFVLLPGQSVLTINCWKIW